MWRGEQQWMRDRPGPCPLGPDHLPATSPSAPDPHPSPPLHHSILQPAQPDLSRASNAKSGNGPASRQAANGHASSLGGGGGGFLGRTW